MEFCPRAGLIFILLFVSGVTGGMKLGMLAGDAIILRRVYGNEKVATQHLHIVSGRPHLHVSNGDVLSSGYDFVEFLIASVIFVTVGIFTIFAATLLIPFALRREMHRITRRKSEGPGVFPLVLFLPLAATMMFTPSLWPNAIGLGLAFCLAWSPRLWFASRIERV